MAAVSAEAKVEFDIQRQQLQPIVTAVHSELVRLQQQIDQGGGGKEGGTQGFPRKEFKPPKLAKEEQWREWASHFAEFLEASGTGMKECGGTSPSKTNR